MHRASTRRQASCWALSEWKRKRFMSLVNILAMQTVGAGGWLSFAPLIFIFAIFYFLLIMPQQRRQKKWQQMLNELKTGDKVVTSGGLRGTVIALRDDYIQLRVPPDNLRLEVTRASIASVIAPEDKNNKAA
jgi:preprotein translocase subunit YajC